VGLPEGEEIMTLAYFVFSQICEITLNFEKIRTKMGNNRVGKKINTPKVNTWVFAFLRKYPGCLKVKVFKLLLALGFYVITMPQLVVASAHLYACAFMLARALLSFKRPLLLFVNRRVCLFVCLSVCPQL